MDELPSEFGPVTQHTITNFRGIVQLQSVSFRYAPENPDALSHINLTLKPGQFVTMIGRSGSGKTTFVNLLRRFYSPTEGIVSLDSTDIEELTVPQVATILNIPLGTAKSRLSYALACLRQKIAQPTGEV